MAELETLRAGLVKSAEAEQMRSLELVPKCFSPEETEHLFALAAGEPGSATGIMRGTRAAFDRLRPALHGLRSFTPERASTAFRDHPTTPLPRAAGRDLTYLRDMTGLDALETTILGVTRAERGRYPFTVRAGLTSLVLGMPLSSPADLLSHGLRSLSPDEVVAIFHASAKSLVRLDLSLRSTSSTAALAWDIVGAFLRAFPGLEHLGVRISPFSVFQPQSLVLAPTIRSLRLINVQPSVAALEVLGCAGVRRLTIGRTQPVGTCAWAQIVGSAALEALAVVRVEEVLRAHARAALEIWTVAQRSNLAQACARRGIFLEAFWHSQVREGLDSPR